MDKLEFKINEWEDEDELLCKEVTILINDQEFTDMLDKFELPGTRKGNLELLGTGYMGLPPAELYKHLTDSAAFSYNKDGKVAIMVCSGCGEEGCLSFEISIITEPHRIIWKNFEHGTDADRHHYYSHFRPLTFNVDQYNEQLNMLKEHF